MKTIKQFIEEESGRRGLGYDVRSMMLTNFQVEQLLIKYGRMVVDECAGSFECTKEYNTKFGDTDFDEDEGKPVLMRSSVLEVKKQIK